MHNTKGDLSLKLFYGPNRYTNNQKKQIILAKLAVVLVIYRSVSLAVGPSGD